MKLKVNGVAGALLLSLAASLCHAQEFSADVVYRTITAPGAPAAGTASAPHEPSRLYVSKEHLRLETRGPTGTILLADRSAETAYAVYPIQKAYQPLNSGPSQYFRVENAEDACPDWQRASDQKIVCEKLGHDVVAGRKAVKYRNQGALDEATAAVWVDPALKFVVRWESATTGAELSNVKEAPQAADLFVVPAGYQILQPQKAKSKGFPQKPH